MKKSFVIVSIILPTYNRSDLINRSIESLLSQTFTDFELIIVDDGSTDNTEAVVKNFSDHRIRYIKLPQNKGANFARNVGIKESKGNYIAFQDSDDEWHPNKLELQVNAIQNTSEDIGVVYTGFLRISHDKKTYIPKGYIKKKDGNLFNEIIKENFIGTPAVLVKKECFDRVGLFDEQLPRFQDWELFIRIATQFNFKYIDQPLFNQYLNNDNISSNKKNSINALAYIIKKHKKIYPINYFSFICFHIGLSYILNGSYNYGLPFFKEAFCQTPSKLKFILVDLPFFFMKSCIVNFTIFIKYLIVISP